MGWQGFFRCIDDHLGATLGATLGMGISSCPQTLSDPEMCKPCVRNNLRVLTGHMVYTLFRTHNHHDGILADSLANNSHFGRIFLAPTMGEC